MVDYLLFSFFNCGSWARNPLLAGNNPIKQKLWRQNNKGYWKGWRRKHPGYVLRNRKAQRVRNAKCRGLIAKGNASNGVYIEKLHQIRHLHLIAKGNAWQEVIRYQIDGICQYLRGQLLIAKGNAIDKRVPYVRRW